VRWESFGERGFWEVNTGEMRRNLEVIYKK
jgi:hypothetical protein